MHKIEDFIHRVSRLDKGLVAKPSGLPVIEHSSYRLPRDLECFYRLCGGTATLFAGSPFPSGVLRPEEVVYATPKILTTSYEEDPIYYDNRSSRSLYLVGFGSTGDITISLDPERTDFGYCFDSGGSQHGEADSRVISKSFTELLTTILAKEGESPLWEGNTYGYFDD